MRIIKEREGGIVRRVHLLDDNGEPIVVVSRFLAHLAERSWSPHTLCAYGYDLQQLFIFLAREQLAWQAFEPADALRFLAFLRRRPSQRPAQRLGLTLVDGGTRVHMIHDGFRPENEFAYDAMRPGWGRVLDGVARVTGTLP